jgi:hypothetical protein
MENNLENLYNLNNALKGFTIDNLVDKVLSTIKYFNPRLDFSSQEIKIKNSSGNSVVVLTESIAIKIFKYKTEYVNELDIIQRLNDDKYPNIVQLCCFENRYQMIVIEKLELIYQDKRIKEIYNKKEFIIMLFIIVLSTINKLYQYGKYNDDFSYSNIGTSLKDSQIKIFDLGLCIDIEDNIKFEVLYNSFNNFVEDILRLLENSGEIELRHKIVNCIEIFKNIHVKREEVKFKLQTRYKYSFKDLEFDVMINTLERC